MALPRRARPGLAATISSARRPIPCRTSRGSTTSSPAARRMASPLPRVVRSHAPGMSCSSSTPLPVSTANPLPERSDQWGDVSGAGHLARHVSPWQDHRSAGPARFSRADLGVSSTSRLTLHLQHSTDTLREWRRPFCRRAAPSSPVNGALPRARTGFADRRPRTIRLTVHRGDAARCGPEVPQAEATAPRSGGRTSTSGGPPSPSLLGGESAPSRIEGCHHLLSNPCRDSTGEGRSRSFEGDLSP